MHTIRFSFLAAACAAFACSALADIPAASEYLQAGLIHHWDGVENVGLGQPHDSSATEWVDLVNSENTPWHINSNATWLDYGLRFKGSGVVDTAGPSSMLEFGDDNCCTVEFIYNNEAPAKATIICGLSWKEAYLYTDTAGHIGFYGGSATSGRVGVKENYSSFIAYSVVYDQAGTVKKFYVNTFETANEGMNDFWGNRNRCLGGRGGGLPAKGDLLTIRVYKRELSAEEIYSNFILDSQRFDPLPLGAKVQFSAEGGGLVSVNGETVETYDENTLPGETFTVNPVDTATSKFAFWRIWKGEQVPYASTKREQSFTVAVDDVHMEAVFMNSASVGDNRIFKYKTEGLVAMWDGISNVGISEVHDGESTVWKDLVGGLDLSLDTTRGAWLDNGLDCFGANGGVPASNTVSRSECDTLEIVMDASTATSDPVIFWTGKNTRFVSAAHLKYHVTGAHGGYAYPMGTEPATVTFTYSGSSILNCYTNGVLSVANTEKKVSWSNSSGGVIIGGHFTGQANCRPMTVYTVRLYNRVLSEKEIFKNAQIDGWRFFGRKIPTGTILTLR